MKEDRASQTALKVAYALLTLSHSDEWAERLPAGFAETTERLLVTSGERGYGPWLMRAAGKPWMLGVHRLQDRMMPGQFEGFAHRKLFVQQEVESAIADGARQVLVIGAGFDTLCLRLAPVHPDVRFVEVDHPATSAAKQLGIAEMGRPDNMWLVDADLGESALPAVLAGVEEWDDSRRSVLVAEGLLQYLADDDVVGLFRDAATCVPATSRMVFTHAIPDDRRALKRILRLTGEPFLSALDSADVPRYVASTGWRVISDADDDPAHGIERYAVAERE